MDIAEQLAVLMNMYIRAESSGVRLTFTPAPYDEARIGTHVPLDGSNFSLINRGFIDQDALHSVLGSFDPISHRLKFGGISISYRSPNSRTMGISSSSPILTLNDLPIPTQPLVSGDLGNYLARQSVMRIADPGILGLLWQFLDAVERAEAECKAILTEKLSYNMRYSGDILAPEHIIKFASDPRLAGEISAICQGQEETLERAASIYGGLEAFERKEYVLTVGRNDVYISHIALEGCNRACGHCCMAATTQLPDLSPEVFGQWLQRLELGDTVTLTFGEPFYSASFQHVVATVLSKGRDLNIITSGINFASEREQSAASFLANLPDDWKPRVSIAISVSNKPHFRLSGMAHDEAARKVQLDTLNFAIANGFGFNFVSFLPSTQLATELLIPALGVVIPDGNFTGLLMKYDDRHRQERALGRKALSPQGRRYLDISQKSTALPYPSCLLSRPAAGVKIAIAYDSALLGCCAPETALFSIGSLDDDCHELIRRARAHVADIKAFDRKKQSRGLGRINCGECMAHAHVLRSPERAERIIGPQNHARVLAIRAALQERRRG